MRETICLIAGSKNEALALPRFFEHHAWVDEILVMDSSSTDNTQEICHKFNRTYHRAELNGNANTRHNLALTLCKSDWICLIDPDEYISGELQQEILSFLKLKDNTYSAYEFPRINYFMDRPLYHGGRSGYSLKIFRKDCVKFIGNAYHENAFVNGKTGKLKGRVDHYPSPNIHWIIQKLNYISEFDLETYHNKFGVLTEKQFKMMVLRRPLKNFWKCYIKKKGFKDGLHGFIYAALCFAFDVIRICKYGEKYLIKNPNITSANKLPDPWECRK
jgi:glycosyltransferase involved in cell wall biosynthesis